MSEVDSFEKSLEPVEALVLGSMATVAALAVVGAGVIAKKVWDAGLREQAEAAADLIYHGGNK